MSDLTGLRPVQWANPFWMGTAQTHHDGISALTLLSTEFDLAALIHPNRNSGVLLRVRFRSTFVPPERTGCALDVWEKVLVGLLTLGADTFRTR